MKLQQECFRHVEHPSREDRSSHVRSQPTAVPCSSSDPSYAYRSTSVFFPCGTQKCPTAKQFELLVQVTPVSALSVAPVGLGLDTATVPLVPVVTASVFLPPAAE